ncbi:hypothetical protein RI129_007902 [Pyrocoelia pectoralis]|uniref:Glucose-methanol-choline oxidoreductase N-terminal domain-containing protein n=1 Tax=Pyrocoelia pectoralis TaxID=417401 RepID=A0AAN7ZHF0_9COLE
MKQFAILVLTFAYLANGQEDLLKYYIKLIKDESSRAYKTPLPKNAYEHIPKSKGYKVYGTYDNIIVGAGASGSILANRLSEDSSRQVLLLEAGGYPNNFTDIPYMRTYLAGTEYNWGYLTVPQTTACLGYINQQCVAYRGKGLGGTTLINGLTYIRGNKEDYNNWFALGNYGWSFKEVLPYFKKSENYPDGDPEYRGRGGYMNVEEWREVNPQTEAFFEANKFLGRKELDYNAKEQLGYAKIQFNTNHGKRQDAGTAFLLPILERKNLEILTNSYVIKILVSKRKKAFGVIFTRNGETYVAKSRRDIIISAGAFGSPQLLMLSGIGPKADLESHGIPVVEDLPVGKYLDEHPGICFIDFVTNYTEPQGSLEDYVRQYLKGAGPFTNTFNVQGVALIQTKYAKVPGYADGEIIMFPSINSDDLTERFWNVERDVASKNINPERSFTLMGVFFNPKSKGYMKLKSANPFEYPLINPMLLSDENNEDIDRLYHIIELIMELLNTPPFQKFEPKLKYGPLAACKDYIYLSKDYCSSKDKFMGIIIINKIKQAIQTLSKMSHLVIKLLAVCATLSQVTGSVNNDSVNDYINLIVAEISRAFTYRLPTDSSSFETNSIVSHDGVYDYIIVGAGYAGSVIASRLTEDSHIKVLLLEAGGLESGFSDIPRMSEYLRGLEYNWNFKTTHQSASCLGMVNGKCSFPSGKGLGGSSILSDLSYERGNKIDYDSWCEQGMFGWCYNDVLPLFKKSENFKIPDRDDEYHGTGGPLNVEPVKLCHRQLDAFIEANIELGREEKNTVNGARQSVANAFLNNALNRTNLKISSSSLVTKIITFLNKATGVHFSRRGRLYKAKATKEIILAAGAIGSAQLLMLSGIGPKNHIRSKDIPIVKDLPVGENFQDHPAYLALHFVTNYTEPVVSIDENVRDYLEGFGSYTVGGNTQGLAFVKVNQSDRYERPDIQLVIIPSNNTNYFEQRAYNYNEETYNAIWPKLDPRRSFTIKIVLLHPKSRGTVRLRSSSPYLYPSIDSNLFSDRNGDDIENMYRGILAAIELVETNAFKNINAVLFDATVPACSCHVYLSKQYWYCQIRHLAVPLGRIVGTSKMGPYGSKDAVVSNDLRVHGMKRLRVADSSIIPSSVSADPSIASIMIGEKVSELIKRHL